MSAPALKHSAARWSTAMLNRCIVRSAMILAIAVSAGASANAQNAVKVGMVMPMPGGLAAGGRQVVAGARLYIKQHGDKVAGRQIELLVKDGASSPETGKRLMQELIVNDKVDVIGGGATPAPPPRSHPLSETRIPPRLLTPSHTTPGCERCPLFPITSDL